jgi:hypothetical protein
MMGAENKPASWVYHRCVLSQAYGGIPGICGEARRSIEFNQFASRRNIKE